MTGHLLGLIVKANTGEEKNRHKGCNIGLLDGEGRPNTVSCWEATESWPWACSPPLPSRWRRTLAHTPHRDVKMGTLSLNTRWRTHPRVPQTRTASSSNLDSSLRCRDLPLHPKIYFLWTCTKSELWRTLPWILLFTLDVWASSKADWFEVCPGTSLGDGQASGQNWTGSSV